MSRCRGCCGSDSFEAAKIFRYGVRGPRYKSDGRAVFEIRRNAATVIDRAWWIAGQLNSRALLSFGLTSSCYRVEQRIIGSAYGHALPAGGSRFKGCRCHAEAS